MSPIRRKKVESSRSPANKEKQINETVDETTEKRSPKRASRPKKCVGPSAQSAVGPIDPSEGIINQRDDDRRVHALESKKKGEPSQRETERVDDDDRLNASAPTV